MNKYVINVCCFLIPAQIVLLSFALLCFADFFFWEIEGLGQSPGGTSGKEHACQCRRHERPRFSPWIGKIPWRRKWQPIPVSLPGESHGQRSLEGYSQWGRTELDMIEQLSRMTGLRCLEREWDPFLGMNVENCCFLFSMSSPSQRRLGELLARGTCRILVASFL